MLLLSEEDVPSLDPARNTWVLFRSLPPDCHIRTVAYPLFIAYKIGNMFFPRRNGS